MGPKQGYHHGDLRRALVQAARQAAAEGGLASVSVADAARRVGVSPAAPYRHFPNRQALLLAIAVETARSLAERLQEIRDAEVSRGAAEALADCAGVYTRFYLEWGVGLDLIYLAELKQFKDVELANEGRRIMDLVLPLAQGIAGAPEGGVVLLEQVFAIAHGYAQLHKVALSPRRLISADDAANAATATVRLVASRTAELRLQAQ